MSPIQGLCARCLTGFRQFLKDGLLDWILSLRNEQVNSEQLVREGVYNLPLPVLTTSKVMVFTQYHLAC